MQNRCAAGVGGKISAELAAAFGTQAQRKEALCSIRCRLDFRQHAARLRNQRVIQWIDATHLAHPRHRDDHFVICVAGRCAPAVAGIAAHGHDTDALPMADLQ